MNFIIVVVVVVTLAVNQPGSVQTTNFVSPSIAVASVSILFSKSEFSLHSPAPGCLLSSSPTQKSKFPEECQQLALMQLGSTQGKAVREWGEEK